MTLDPLRSERLRGASAAINEELPGHTRVGIVSLLRSFLNRNWFAVAFPSHSEDWGVSYTSGTDYGAFYDRAEAAIPSLRRPMDADDMRDDDLYDLVEFCGRYVQQPSPARRRDELKFNRSAGVSAYRGELNELLRTGGSVFTLSAHLRIERVLATETVATLATLGSGTDDPTLDDYLARARAGIVSRKREDRDHALQAFWAAFDYLKTMDVPGRGNKRRSIGVLLDAITPEQLRDVVEADMKVLTDAGNTFRIRHHETDAVDLTEPGKDYLAGRMATLLLALLRESGRMRDDS